MTQLSTVRPEALEAACKKLVIIGCGDWILINNYRGSFRTRGDLSLLFTLYHRNHLHCTTSPHILLRRPFAHIVPDHWPHRFDPRAHSAR